MPVFQGEKVEQQQQGRRVFQGEPVSRQRPDTPVATSVPEGQGDFITGGGPLGFGRQENISEMQRQREGIGPLDAAIGAGEAVYGAAKGLAGEAAGGVAALWELGSTEPLKDPSQSPVENAIYKLEAMRDAFSYDPKSRAGGLILRSLSEDPATRQLLDTARSGGQSVLDATGSPALAAGTQALLEVAPGMLAPESRFRVRGAERGEAFAPEQPSELAPTTPQGADVQDLPATRKAKKSDIARVQSALGREGISISSRKGLLNTIERLGERVQQPGFASSLETVRDALVRAKTVEEKTEKRLWDTAREGPPAAVRREDLVEFEQQLDEALDGFAVDEMGSLNNRLKELRQGIEGAPEGSAIKLRKLMDWRKSLNKNMPTQRSPERTAYTRTKKNLDNFLLTKFNTDMIKGDPESLARWRAAIGKSAEIRELFEDDKIIRQLAKHDAEPEQLRNLLFNASAVGAKANAASTVKGLKRIFGENADEIVALRQESLYNVMEPLLSETPDFARFQANYDKFVKKNRGMINELFPKNSQDSLQALYSASKSARPRQAIEKRTGKDVADVVSVGLFGHGIAQAGLKVRLAKDITRAIISGRNDSIKKEVMRDFLGYDATKPLFSTPAKRALVLEGVIQNQEEEQ